MLRDTSKELSNQTLDLLADLDAVHTILKRGWCQKALVDKAGNHCVIGAVQNVVQGDNLRHINLRHAITGAAEIFTVTEQNDMVAWNDRKGRTQEEVLNLIAKAKAQVIQKVKS